LTLPLICQPGNINHTPIFHGLFWDFREGVRDFSEWYAPRV
jgi:hypothetical protein